MIQEEDYKERDLDTDLEGLVLMLRQYRLRGYTVHEAAAALGVSTKTIFRWLKEGKLRGEKYRLATRIGYFWLIDPISIAKIQVRKEVEDEVRKEMEMERQKKGGKRASSG
jgi:excisionase family DNA binding protein